MKWFKHISDSLDDPFIFDLCQECGPTGYYVFFGVLEIYSREFKTENAFMLEVSWSYLCSKLVASRSQHIKKALLYCNERGRFEVKFNGKNVSIFIPKFKKYLDEFTLKKLRLSEQKSGATPDSLRIESGDTPINVRTEVEVDTDIKEIKKENALDSLVLDCLLETKFDKYKTKTEAHERIVQKICEELEALGYKIKREFKVFKVKEDRNGYIDIRAERDGHVCLLEIDSCIRRKSLDKLQQNTADLKIQIIYTENIKINYNPVNGIWFIGIEAFSCPPSDIYSESFEMWWKLYPKKVGKDAAYKAWQKVAKRKTVTVTELTNAIQQQVDACHFKGSNGDDFIPQPSTWLNQGRWMDELKQPCKTVTPKQYVKTYADE
ncbi:MAG: hypothetical protein RBT80_26280 [Candidatus Vecturithrix sp.]|jgi:hypothetical protein|nr:hypothetical protein [Candidatus Vecturithrix sp.]